MFLNTTISSKQSCEQGEREKSELVRSIAPKDDYRYYEYCLGRFGIFLPKDLKRDALRMLDYGFDLRGRRLEKISVMPTDAAVRHWLKWHFTEKVVIRLCDGIVGVVKEGFLFVYAKEKAAINSVNLEDSRLYRVTEDLNKKYHLPRLRYPYPRHHAPVHSGVKRKVMPPALPRITSDYENIPLPELQQLQLHQQDAFGNTYGDHEPKRRKIEPLPDESHQRRAEPLRLELLEKDPWIGFSLCPLKFC